MVAMKKCEPKYEPRCRIFFAEGQKFRTNLLVLFFDLSLKRETATKTALLAEVLRQGENPTGAARQEELLFGAHWDISVVKKGGRQLLLFSWGQRKMGKQRKRLRFWERGWLRRCRTALRRKPWSGRRKFCDRNWKTKGMIKRHLHADEPWRKPQREQHLRFRGTAMRRIWRKSVQRGCLHFIGSFWKRQK